MKLKNYTKSNSENTEVAAIKNKVGNNESNHHAVDEDWSIISSSSDFDDERSTTSSTDHQYKVNLNLDQGGGDKEIKKTDLKNSINQSILKVPNLIATEDDQNIELSTSSPQILNSSSIPESNTSSNSILSDDLSNSINVGSRIKFFENLNDFNESIKQKSNDFYSNFAKIKIDQLNRYIYDQHSSINDSAADDNKDSEQQPTDVKKEKKLSVDETDLDDTIELVKSIDKYQEIKVLQNNSKKEDLKTIDKPQEDSKNIRKPLGAKFLSAIENFLESNSDYLYYYLFVFVVGLIPTIYLVNNYINQPLPTTIVKSPTLNDKIINYWNNLVYEETEVINDRGIFGFHARPKKLIRVNKLSKLAKSLKANLQNDYLKLTNVGKEIDKFVVKNIAPNLQKIIAKVENGVLLTSKNLQTLGEKLRDFGHIKFHQISKISRSSYEVLKKYSQTGLTEIINQEKFFTEKAINFFKQSSNQFQVFLNNASHASKFIFTKSKDVLVDQSINFKNFLSNVNKANTKIGQYGLSKFKQLSNDTQNLWLIYSPKFSNLITQESIFIYKKSLDFKNMIREYVI
ncbi:hypothetical protein KGF54_002156 [Candida jiufengensis]|uniref:uncharacterized protein n=1 Tax=Candida jiufengensis TaxID=497108 RepID=UPI0022252971|nr:uncharacterized protein KGF54_002156 [Candida jiufengensis]KAI5954381.1 hypothetical protein KGF54_002156 [Candida jiufengensis]